MKIKILLITTLFLLTSCNNFHTFNLTSYELSVISETRAIEKVANPQVVEPTKPEVIIKEVPIVKTQIEYICPRFILPELEDFPSLPMDELNKIDPTDFKAIDKELMKYISKVIKFDKYARELIKSSYEEYIKKC